MAKGIPAGGGGAGGGRGEGWEKGEAKKEDAGRRSKAIARSESGVWCLGFKNVFLCELCGANNSLNLIS